MNNARFDDFLLPIGRWGRLHLDYIKENQMSRLKELTKTNMLWNYLNDIDIQAQSKFEKLIDELQEKSEISFQTKECIIFLAEEMVLEEIIYYTP